jgi:hypothetical protein
MAPFIIPAAVVLGLVGLYAATRGPSAAATAAATAKAKAAAATSGPAIFPADVQPDLDRLLNAPPDQDPAALETVASRLEALGFKTQATALRLKAAQLRADQGTSATPAPPAPPTPRAAPPPSPTPAVSPQQIVFTPGVFDEAAPPPFVPGVIDEVAIVQEPVAPTVLLAVVTTSDPAPSGDLVIRDQPSNSGQVIGAAEKNGTVTVLNLDASPDFAEIVWKGGARRPAAHGFAHKSFLRAI